MSLARKTFQSAFSSIGIKIGRQERTTPFPVELTNAEKEIFEFVKSNRLSLASDERLYTTMMACKHVLERDIAGDFVECGVWRGGNALLAAAIFKLHNSSRHTYLFDTYGGMTAPTEHDVNAGSGESAQQKFDASQTETHNAWCYASLEDVKSNFTKAGLLGDNVHFIKGDVLQTLANPANLPETVAVLRLDTDWYESTKMELETLYPRVPRGGVLIIDDYGHWAGAKKATDEYFTAHGARPFLQYTDYTGRVGVKFD